MKIIIFKRIGSRWDIVLLSRYPVSPLKVIEKFLINNQKCMTYKNENVMDNNCG